MNINKHKLYLIRILKDIYEDIELANLLGFKGGTALMFFYQLPRFSVDLDFHLIQTDKEHLVYEKIRSILNKHGEIYDEAIKHFGPLLVLDYGYGERKLKVEISNRPYPNHYEIKNLLGITVQVMTRPDMFAHKLCALLDRNVMTNRDLFDIWFFLQRNTEINSQIVQERMNMPLEDYLGECINALEKVSDRNLLQGMGELLQDDLKHFVKTKLRRETITMLRQFREFPVISNQIQGRDSESGV